MKILSIIFTILISLTTACGQKLIKKTFENSSPPYKEIYYVLKSDGQTKQGAYVKEVRRTVWVQGQFQNGEKSGIWEYFDMNGKLAQKFDFDSGELLYNRFEDEMQDYNVLEYSKPAIVLGGLSTIYKNVEYLLRYPSGAFRMEIQGKVYIKFTVDEFGRMDNPEIIEGIGGGCDEEALRVMEIIDQEWIPAFDLNGNPVKSEITLPITFRLG